MDPIQAQALKEITQLFLGGAAGGVAARLGIGALRNLRSNVQNANVSFHPRPSREIIIDVDSPEKKKPNTNLDGGSSYPVKTASALGDLASTIYSGAADLASPITNMLPEYRTMLDASNTPNSPKGAPWYQYGRFLAPMIGLPAAYSITGNILQGVRNKNELDEIDNAKEEYYTALAKAIAQNRKSAANTSYPGSKFLAKLAAEFDMVYDKVESGELQIKKAEEDFIPVIKNLGRVLFPLNNLGNSGAALTGLIATGAGALGASNAYRNNRMTSISKMLRDEAERLRKEEEEKNVVFKARLPDGTVTSFRG